MALGKHKKIIASVVPLAIIGVVLALLVANIGGEEYEMYVNWLALARLSSLAVFAFYSGLAYEITFINLLAQFVIFIFDIYFGLYAVRCAHYATLAALTAMILIQTFKIMRIGELLQCELNERKSLPRSKIQSFGAVNSVIIGLLAVTFLDSYWLYVLAAEINIYELYILTRGTEDTFWTVVTVVASTAANVVVHFASYGLPTSEIVEVFDFEKSSLENINVYCLRSLTLVNVFIDIFIAATVTHTLRKLLCRKSKYM